MRLIDADALKQAIATIMPSRTEVNIVIDEQPTIALLKEQEAVPVKQCEVMHMLVWCCGSCGVAITDGDKFCRNCGKKMKWDA